MTMHSIVGLMNSGKTLYMTYLLFLDYLKGRKIFSNYHLNFPHTIIKKEELIKLAKSGEPTDNISFGFDELWIWLDCRKAMENTIMTYFFLQSSKGDTKIYFTTQNEGQNDLRIKQNIHLISTCERRLLIEGKFKKISDEIRILPPPFQRFLIIKVKTYVRRLIGLESELVKKKTTRLVASKIFPLYDTNIKQKYEG